MALVKFYYVTNVFDLHSFDNETMAFLIFFEISSEMNFVSLLFLDEGNIQISLLMIHLKCTIAHYANLNSSSINKLFLHYRPLNILFRFFRFHFNVYSKEAFVKKFMKQLSFFNTIFKYSFQDVVYYRILGCQTL